MANYDAWRLQTPEEYFGTENEDFIPCNRCGVVSGDHDDHCETCEGVDCGECEGNGCEFEEGM